MAKFDDDLQIKGSSKLAANSAVTERMVDAALEAWDQLGPNNDDRAMRAAIGAALREMPAPVWTVEECSRVTQTLRYIQGIAERGGGRPMREDETLEAFVLGYVKRLEQKG